MADSNILATTHSFHSPMDSYEADSPPPHRAHSRPASSSDSTYTIRPLSSASRPPLPIRQLADTSERDSGLAAYSSFFGTTGCIQLSFSEASFCFQLAVSDSKHFATSEAAAVGVIVIASL